MMLILAAALLLPVNTAQTFEVTKHTEICKADAAKRFIGKQDTPENIAQIKKLTDATTIRTLRIGMIMTLEYMFGRVNVLTDAKGKITGINCG